MGHQYQNNLFPNLFNDQTYIWQSHTNEYGDYEIQSHFETICMVQGLPIA
jgi:hypothetical protein